MAGKIRGSAGRALRRVMLRAALAAGGSLAVALSVGAAAAVFGLSPTAPLAEAAAGPVVVTVADVLPAAAPDLPALASAEPAALAIAVETQPFEATRLAPEPAGEAVSPAAAVPAAVAPPALEVGDRANVTLSFYYCEAGENPAVLGDGGGFCGVMRDGSVVRPGAAACALDYLGQRFRIEGDPDARTYVCNDTGNLVHGLHRDIWFNVADDGANWLLKVGRVAVIEILP